MNPSNLRHPLALALTAALAWLLWLGWPWFQRQLGGTWLLDLGLVLLPVYIFGALFILERAGALIERRWRR